MFSRHSPLVSERILTVIDKIIQGALMEEINATIHEKLKGRYSVEKIDAMLEQYHETGVIPDEISEI